MKFTVSISGSDNIAELKEQLTREVETAVGVCAAELEAEVKNSLSVSALEGGKLRPSPPGTPPHRRSGNLQNSIGCETTEESDTVFTAAVGDIAGRAPYAKELEYGTQTVRARPFLLPALIAGARRLAERVRAIAKGGRQ